MPYRTQPVQAETAFNYKGVTIYYTYKDDDVDQGTNKYWFTTDPDGLEEDPTAFDVRSLNVPTAKLLETAHPPFLSGPHYDAASEDLRAQWKQQWEVWHESAEGAIIQQILTEAIDAGLLKN